MVKIIIAVVAIAAFVATAQSAGVHDAEAQINRVGSQLRVEAIMKIKQNVAAAAQGATAEKQACLRQREGLAMRELNIRLGMAQQQLRSEIPANLARLPGMSVEQVIQEYSDRLSPVVNGVVDEQMAQINAC